MKEKLRGKLLKQAETFKKFKSAFEARKQEEVLAEVCQGLHNICIMLAEVEEVKDK